MAGGRRWEGWEDEVLADVYPRRGARACAEMLGRTEGACALRAARIGVGSGHTARRWTPEEDRACALGLVGACRATGRTPVAVIARMRQLLERARAGERL